MIKIKLTLVLIVLSFYIRAQVNPLCGSTFTVSTTLTSNCDCSGFAGTAFTIGANNITLDLNGYTLTVAAGRIGVLINGRSSVTVTSGVPGGVIAGGSVGVEFQSINSNVEISNFTFTGTTPDYAIGIFNGAAVNGLLVNAVTSNNRLHGFYSGSGIPGSNVTIQNSTFDNNTNGIYIVNIAGVHISNASVQNNTGSGAFFQSISGTSSVSGLNVTGSSRGLSFGGGNFSGFPAITPAAVTFGSNNVAIQFEATVSSNVSISGVDLSGPPANGYGNAIFNGAAVNNLLIDGVTSNNRLYGFYSASSTPSSNVTIQNSVFNNNVNGISIVNTAGVHILNVSAQNNSAVGAFFQSISGTSSVSGLNVTGSSTGLSLGGGNFSGFPAITPAAVTFGGNDVAIKFEATTSSNISISGVDLSGPSANGIGNAIINGAAVNNLLIDGITSNNRLYGFYSISSNPSSNVTIQNSTFNNNVNGVTIHNTSGFTLSGNTISDNQTGLNLSAVSSYNIFHNNIYNNSNVNVFGDQAYELWNHTTNEGNYWGHVCPTAFSSADANRIDIVDNFAYGDLNGWQTSGINPCNGPSPPTRYWVGNGSNTSWNDPANWSFTSGGSGGASVPSSANNVVFDGSGNGNCSIDAEVNVLEMIISGYGGTIAQNNFNITVDVSGFSINSGIFNGGMADVTVKGDFLVSGGSFTSTQTTLFVGGNYNISGGTFLHNNGIVIFNGSTIQSVSINNTDQKFNKMQVHKTSGKLNIQTPISVIN